MKLDETDIDFLLIFFLIFTIPAITMMLLYGLYKTGAWIVTRGIWRRLWLTLLYPKTQQIIWKRKKKH